MRHAGFSLLAAAICHGSVQAQTLRTRPLGPERLISNQVITGRAVCGGTTWLLTDAPELTVVSAQPAYSSVSVSLRGLQKDEKPWGLACLPNNELWTLASHDVLARLEPDGRVAERVRLDGPRLGIFSTGQRLLLQHPPTAKTQPLLSIGLPRKLSGFAPWPSPLSQPTSSRAALLKANLVNCGIGADGYVPCWLVAETRLAISDGSTSHTTIHDLDFVRAGPVNDEVPIWDVALAGASRVWVLASARGAPDGRRLGGRLTKSDRHRAASRFVDVSPPPRLILWAGEDRCVLLSSTGQLLEVSDR